MEYLGNVVRIGTRTGKKLLDDKTRRRNKKDDLE